MYGLINSETMVPDLTPPILAGLVQVTKTEILSKGLVSILSGKNEAATRSVH
jgi:hypothetical protein